jgi:hypothetical protein
MCEISANSNMATARNLQVTDMSDGFTVQWGFTLVRLLMSPTYNTKAPPPPPQHWPKVWHKVSWHMCGPTANQIRLERSSRPIEMRLAFSAPLAEALRDFPQSRGNVEASFHPPPAIPPSSREELATLCSLVLAGAAPYIYTVQGKGKVLPRTGHESPEEMRYSCTLSLTSALDRVCGQRHTPDGFTSGKTPVPIVWETAWALVMV